MKKKELKGNLHYIFKSWKLKKSNLIFKLPTGDSFYLPRYQTDYIQRLIFQKDNFYESQTLDRIAKLFKQRNIPCNCVLDIGANIGNHTLYFARHLPSKHVYSFEPCKQNFEMLKKNVALNNLTGKISVFNCAVGRANGQGSVSIADENNLGMVSVEETENGDIKIISLDSILPPPYKKISVWLKSMWKAQNMMCFVE